MPAYRATGGLDDAILTDGDRGFVGMDLRRQSNQLEAGLVRLSQNGRIDGYWQVRKGIELVSGALTSGTEPLRVPFWVIDTPLTGSASRSGTTVTVTSVGHGLGIGLTGYTEISGLTGTVNANGIKNITVVDADTFTYTLSGGSGTETYTGTLSVETVLDDTAVTTVLGSCVFSDPASNNEEYVILATNGVAKKVALVPPYTVTDIEYPGVETLSEPVELIQAFDRVMLFRDGERPWAWVPQGRVIQSSSLTSNVVTVRCKDHGLQVNDVVTISGVGYATTDPNGSRTVASVTSADSFTFALTASNETFTPNTGRVVADFFTLAPAGSYTQPQTFVLTAKDVDVTDGLVSVDLASAGITNTTIVKGDFVTVYKAVTTELNTMEGKTYEVVTATTGLITFYAPVGNYNTSSTDHFEFGGRFSIGGGFMHPPAPPWGVYFQRRLWIPYFYEPNGTYSSPTYTDKKEHDQIAASDILDPATFDQIESQFRVTAGIADYVVGMQPFYDDALMILNRNSLHLVEGTQGSLSDTVLKELTREVGCLARKSVISQGNAVFFLSDNGVYGVEFIEGYNLRGIQEPLSKPIQPIIDRINKGLADKAVGIFFNNRYYLALPLDSEAGADDAVGNNSIIIFNVLNKAWESIDTFGANDFNVMNFHVAQAESRHELYAVSEFGGVHKMESREVPVDKISVDALGGSTEYGVTSILQTRSYDFATQDRKRFSVAQVQCQANNDNCDMTFAFASDDPDSNNTSIGSISTLIGDSLAPEDTANLRMRLGGPRGFMGTLTISSSLVGSQPIGRIKIQSVAIDATSTNRQTISQH